MAFQSLLAKILEIMVSGGIRQVWRRYEGACCAPSHIKFTVLENADTDGSLTDHH